MRADRDAHAMEAEYLGADLGWIHVGDQRAVRRRDDCAPHAGAAAGEHEHPDADRGSPVKMPNTAHTAAPITAMRMRGSRSA